MKPENKAGYDEAQIELTILEPPSVFTEREVFELTAGESFTVDLDIGGTPTPKERSKYHVPYQSVVSLFQMVL